MTGASSKGRGGRRGRGVYAQVRRCVKAHDRAAFPLPRAPALRRSHVPTRSKPPAFTAGQAASRQSDAGRPAVGTRVPSRQDAKHARKSATKPPLTLAISAPWRETQVASSARFMPAALRRDDCLTRHHLPRSADTLPTRQNAHRLRPPGTPWLVSGRLPPVTCYFSPLRRPRSRCAAR